jgi:hypothetical protein
MNVQAVLHGAPGNGAHETAVAIPAAVSRLSVLVAVAPSTDLVKAMERPPFRFSRHLRPTEHTLGYVLTDIDAEGILHYRFTGEIDGNKALA